MDEQVKLRGYRIEPGEIEQALLGAPGIRQAAVVLREVPGGPKGLVGYVVSEGAFDKEAVTAYLKERLPEYMIPAVLTGLDRLPLMANGKIDKRRLPAVDASSSMSAGYAAPRNGLEASLATTWQDLLGVVRVGIHDNFFELGGDSIITIQVVSRLRRLGYGLHPKDIFLHQTIGRLSAAVAGRGQDLRTGGGEQGLLSGKAGLLPIQAMFLEKGGAGVSHFNHTGAGGAP
jgi:aryl carrier-like protein